MAEADKQTLTDQMSTSHGSFELVVSPVILGLGGWWLDGRLGTGPWFLIGAVLFGIIGAATKIYLEYSARMAALRTAAESQRSERASEQAQRRAAAAAERQALEERLLSGLEEVRSR